MVIRLLRRAATEHGAAVICVTHDPRLEAYADRVIHMKDGRVIKEQVFKEKRPILKEKKMEDFLTEEKEENSELKILMNSFKNLLPQQVDMLLIPFKAKQLLAHLLSELNDEQVSMAEAFLKELLFKNIDVPLFTERLDLELDQGGAGWNKLRALKFAKRVEAILAITQGLRTTVEEGALKLGAYLEGTFNLKLNDEQRLRLQAALKLRLESAIGQIELSRKLDKSFIQGGVGLRRDTVEKMAREIEIIMLLKYS
ncbi:MAG: hypothetical protein ACEQSB_04260 [Undibacterium sp.]